MGGVRLVYCSWGLEFQSPEGCQEGLLGRAVPAAILDAQ